MATAKRRPKKGQTGQTDWRNYLRAGLPIVAVVVVVAAILLVGNYRDNHGPEAALVHGDGRNIQDVTVDGPLNGTEHLAMTAQRIQNVNNNQNQTMGTQFFQAKAGYFVNTSGSSEMAVEWGDTLKPLQRVDLKDYLLKTAKRSAPAGTQVYIDDEPSRTVVAKDGSTYKLKCFKFYENAAGSAYFGNGCFGNVQGSTIYLFTQNNTGDKENELDQLVQSLTLVLG